MIISALVIVGYTTLGGFLAASTTDFIQSIIMSIALIIVFSFWGLSIAGGPSAVIDHAKSLPGYLTMMTTYDPVSGTESAYPGYKYCFHDGLGTWLFWYAAYSSSIYGN